MKVASGLASGPHATPELAERAVREALAAAGLERAGRVLLFLSRDFLHQAQAAVVAAARAAGCLQVFGSTASGLFTERDSQLDQPGAAALVLPAHTGDGPPGAGPILSLGGSSLSFSWHAGAARAGMLDADAATWAHGHLATAGGCEFDIPGRHAHLAVSTGLRQLASPLPVDACDAYELRRVAGQPAVASLRRSLPAEWRESLPLSRLAVLRQAAGPGIAILAANADGSLTLAEPLAAGDRISWAVRQPLAAEHDMRQSLQALGKRQPEFALMFSCIGRGPLFYGNDDRDLQVFREEFPGIPLLGAYGNGQIAPLGGKNRLFHNSVITLLFEEAHV